MSGSKMTSTKITEAGKRTTGSDSQTNVAKLRSSVPYVWDGISDDDRPLTREEMLAGVEQYRKRRGRPVGSGKESTTIRFDNDVLAAFRASGPGWQTRMNAALREWLENHSVA